MSKIAVAVVVVGTSLAMSCSHLTATGSTAPARSTGHLSASHKSSPTSPPAHPQSGLHAELIDHLPGYGDELATTPGAVYVRWAVPVRSGVARVWRISRYDVRFGRITAVSPPIRGATSMAVDESALWVSANPRVSGEPISGSLVKLDLSSLHVLDLVTLPTVVGGLGATSSGLWVGGVSRLLLVDPVADRIVRSVPTVGAVGRLAVDPRAGVLYDVTHRPGEETAIALEERDAATGRLITRSTAIENYTAINGLAVIPGNVWVASAGGMSGLAERYTLQGLIRHRPPEGSLMGTNGLDVYATPGILWADNPGGDVSCVDPLTGVSRDRLAQHRYLGAVTWLDGQVYNVIGHRLEHLLPGSACRG